MLVVLNNAKTLTLTISAFPRLRHASLEQLNHWQLESDGVSVSWEDLDEDLSVKGFLQQAAYTIIDSFAH